MPLILWCPREARTFTVNPAEGVEVIGRAIRCPVCRTDHVAETPPEFAQGREAGTRTPPPHTGFTAPGPDVMPTPGELDAFQVAEPMYAARGWIKFLGVVGIIGGVLYCLTIIGAIIGWLPIWVGVLMLRGAGGLERGFATGQTRDVREAFDKLRLAFKIYGIMTIVALAFSVVYIFVVIAVLASAPSRF